LVLPEPGNLNPVRNHGSLHFRFEVAGAAEGTGGHLQVHFFARGNARRASPDRAYDEWTGVRPRKSLDAVSDAVAQW